VPLKEHQVHLAGEHPASIGPYQQDAPGFTPAHLVSGRDHVIVGFELDNMRLHEGILTDEFRFKPTCRMVVIAFLGRSTQGIQTGFRYKRGIIQNLVRR